MFEKKNFILNCDVCDTRKMTEDSLKGYEQIIINADVILVNEKSRALLNQLPAIVNVDDTIEAEGDIDLVSVNGNYEINGETAVSGPKILCINGSLNIAPGTEEVLKNYVSIHVNGNVRCPKNLAPYLSKMSVNGSTDCIPDDCIPLEPVFTIDKYFPLRAKEGNRYYVRSKLVLADPQVNAAMLSAKKVQFVTNKLVVRESMIEQAINLVDETVKLEVIPDGWAYMNSDAELDETLLSKYGNCLYIDGNLKLSAESTPLLERIEKLHVNGNVSLLKGQVDAFRKLDTEYQDLCVIKGGKVIENGALVVVDQKMLDASEDGVTIHNCAVLKINDDVDPQSIIDKLSIGNAGMIRCNPKQRGAVSLVCGNSGMINDGTGEGNEALNFDNPMELLKKMINTKVVNAEKYII